MTRTFTAILTMWRRLRGGWSYALTVGRRWFGFTPTHTAEAATSSPVAVKAITYDDFIVELMDELLPQIEKRLEFEAWADSR